MSTTAIQPVEPDVKPQEPEKDEATGKFVYRFQPRRKDGTFFGKEYRFLYTDQMDLVKQITEAKAEADMFVDDVKTGKRQVVGEPATPKPDFKPAPIKDEKDQQARDDWRRNAEAELGAPLDSVKDRLKFADEVREYQIASTWALQAEASGYYICKENGKALYKYLTDNKLKISAANLDLAFDALKDTLVPKPQEQPPIRAEETPIQAKPASTGIIPGQFNGTRQPNARDRSPLTKERFRQIDKMSRDQWNRLRRESPKEAESFLAMKTPAQPQQ